MNNAFFAAFNVSLGEAQRVMGETFTVDGSEWAAIAVDELDATTRATLGGKLADVSTTVIVAREIAQQSGLAQVKKVTVRGQALRVSDTKDDGDDAITFYCGPVGVGTPRK